MIADLIALLTAMAVSFLLFLGKLVSTIIDMRVSSKSGSMY